MSRLDQCHGQVVRALEKDGWTVEPQPLEINTAERDVYIDIEANRHVNGSSQRIMLAEVKCFPDRKSTTTQLYIALGQYAIYRATLRAIEMDVSLYLAIPRDVYETVFDAIVRNAVQDLRIKLLIVNMETETIVQWIE